MQDFQCEYYSFTRLGSWALFNREVRNHDDNSIADSVKDNVGVGGTSNSLSVRLDNIKEHREEVPNSNNRMMLTKEERYAAR